jgi:sortase A
MLSHPFVSRARALHVRDRLSWLLIVIGIAMLGWVAAQITHARAFQHEQRVAFDRAMDGAPAPNAAIAPTTAIASATPTGLVGRLEIPRLNLNVMVMEGDDEATLKTAVGHLPDTALPWTTGNTALAGHRDTFFRPLKDIRPGDQIRLTSTQGSFVYVVRSTKIVLPTDISVLAPTTGPTLTLVTCYPFYYVGSAPKRYVVQADRLE